MTEKLDSTKRQQHINETAKNRMARFALSSERNGMRRRVHSDQAVREPLQAELAFNGQYIQDYVVLNTTDRSDPTNQFLNAYLDGEAELVTAVSSAYKIIKDAEIAPIVVTERIVHIVIGEGQEEVSGSFDSWFIGESQAGTGTLVLLLPPDKVLLRPDDNTENSKTA